MLHRAARDERSPRINRRGLRASARYPAIGGIDTATPGAEVLALRRAVVPRELVLKFHRHRPEVSTRARIGPGEGCPGAPVGLLGILILERGEFGVGEALVVLR